MRAMLDIQWNAEWWASHHSRSQPAEWFYRVFDPLEAISNAPLSYGVSAENGLFLFEVRDALNWSGKTEELSGHFSSSE